MTPFRRRLLKRRTMLILPSCFFSGLLRASRSFVLSVTPNLHCRYILFKKWRLNEGGTTAGILKYTHTHKKEYYIMDVTCFAKFDWDTRSWAIRNYQQTANKKSFGRNWLVVIVDKYGLKGVRFACVCSASGGERPARFRPFAKR